MFDHYLGCLSISAAVWLVTTCKRVLWDTNAYTRDCLMHDHCVRNDHDTFSGWCSDDAVPASDDQSSANDCIMKDGCSGSCGGYSASGGCWCDSGCDSYGDCCMDKHQKCG